ncbi:DNA (cytosine-5)-methyltransferase 1 [Lentzea californiensis]|nr:DNA cytosine methyltransferase [Lentzea californiensis]MCR3746908.1 DNA (cytosine-5)-methyltransferase 1 [Lentzea californiensis]
MHVICQTRVIEQAGSDNQSDSRKARSVKRIGRAHPTVVSLFSGAGGTDIGLERAGWRTVFATDIDSDCVKTMTASQAAGIPVPGREPTTYFEGTRIVQADVHDLTAADVRPPGASRSWRPSLLAGGPPCQPWSSAGLQLGRNDPRGLLLDQMVRMTDELRPRYVLFENVQGIVTAIGPSGRPGEVLDFLKSEFENLGYATSFAILNSADYGAAERRVRLYMIATEKCSLPDYPEATHTRSAENSLFDQKKPWVSLGEFLEGMPEPEAIDVVRPSGARAEELAKLTPGTGLRTGGVVEANRPSGHWGYRQDSFLADPSLPSRTIRAASTPDWIRLEDGSMRRLTWRECAAIQGFPREWQFTGTVASRFRQIGNAVQADIACALGEQIMSYLARGTVRTPSESAPFPPEFRRRVRYTTAEHRTNAAHRKRVIAKSVG